MKWKPTEAVFDSDFSIDESVARLRSAVRTEPFDTRLKSDAVGEVSASKVRVWHYKPYSLMHSCKPVFTGSFDQTAERVVLRGKFSVNVFVKVLEVYGLIIGVPFVILVMLGLFLSFLNGLFQHLMSDVVMSTVGLAAMGGGWCIIRRLRRAAQEEVRLLSQIISDALHKTDAGVIKSCGP